MEIVYISKTVYFNAAHRLHSEKLSDVENKRIFGKCNNLNGHGHNYRLDVTLRGPVDPITGMVGNLSEIKAIVEKQICERFDHKNLNLDTAEFANLVPTAENIVVTCWHLLKNTVLSSLLYKLVLHETSTNTVEYRGE